MCSNYGAPHRTLLLKPGCPSFFKARSCTKVMWLSQCMTINRPLHQNPAVSSGPTHFQMLPFARRKMTDYVTVPSTFLSFCYYHNSHTLSARKIPDARRLRQRIPSLKAKLVRVIDENGSNLGEMNSTMAVQLADGRGLELILVQRETKDSVPTYKLVSKKQLWDANKRKKQQSKKDPRRVTKNISLTTSIGEHDLLTKLEHIKDFLNKLHSVRVTVESKKRRLDEAQREREKGEQRKMLAEIEKGLEGLGTKFSQETFFGNRLNCTFQSIVQSEKH